MKILPVFSTSTFFEYVVELDGADWILRFRWSARADAWMLDVLNAREEVRAAGVRLVLGVDLLKGYPGDKPLGMLAVITLDAADARDPGFLSFDQGHRLVYFTAREIEPTPPESLRIWDAV